MQSIATDDPSCNDLDVFIDVTPMARASIDEACLPIPDQGFFTNELCYSTEEVEASMEDEEVIKVDQDIMNDLEHAFCHHWFK